MTDLDVKALVERLQVAAGIFDRHPSEVYAANTICREAATALLSLSEKVEGFSDAAGLGCDANGGGAHQVIKQGSYSFCGSCGETITQADLRERCRAVEQRVQKMEEALRDVLPSLKDSIQLLDMYGASTAEHTSVYHSARKALKEQP